MTISKGFLLGSAMALVSVNAAHSADLPVRKAAPVDYVRVCDFTGAGFFYIPGTDTCLQISGTMRVEGAFINNSRLFFPVPGIPNRSTGTFGLVPGRDRDESGFLARARLGVDSRTQTAYGTLRTFLQYQIDRLQGIYSGGGPNGGVNTFANSGGNNAALRRGFIQFAGITAGRLQSFFDFYADNYNYEGIANSDLSNNVFAYTYNAGGGFSATVSIEDRNARNLPQNLGNILGGPNNVAGAARYAGETVPDVVGVLRYDQTWGSAQLSGAYHQIQSTSGSFAGTGGQGFSTADTDGFAVQGGVRLKLPMLAAGDDLWLQGAYQEGAYTYMDSGVYFNGGFNSIAVGGFQHIDRDAVAVHLVGTPTAAYVLDKGRGFSVMAAFNHYFTPNFHDVVFGSYEEITYGNGVKNIDWTLGGIGDASQFRVGNQFLWDPVKNFEIGLEVDYLHIDQTLAHNAGQVATRIPVGVSKNPDAFETRLRFQRDF